MIQRKKHTDVSDAEWSLFIDAVNSMHGTQAQSPKYREFVKIHVDAMAHGSSWGVHTMSGVQGRNFLAWHRQYLSVFEKRLQKYNDSIFIPYWDWENNTTIPKAISGQQLLDKWSVTRNYRSKMMPTESMLDFVASEQDFDIFQDRLENVHNPVHRAVGGNMDSVSSPSDPIFWMHHANIDRIWYRWQKSSNGKSPSNLEEIMMPENYLNVKVASVINITKLGYGYASQQIIPADR